MRFKSIKNLPGSYTWLLLPLLLIGGCAGDDPSVPDPGKATLTFPVQNAVCTTGTVVSATESTITFTWNTSANTDSYEVAYKNLLTGALASKTSATNQVSITLLRNTPYAWSVFSRSNSSSGITQSDVWKFYNSGTGTVSHPPFPADVVSPQFGQAIAAGTGTVNLSWTGSDADGDIKDYDVYFGSSPTPALIKSALLTASATGIAITSGNTYYWKVITRDVTGNTSESGLFQFKVN